VFYEVDEPGVVTILAIGTKRGNKLCIEGEEIESDTPREAGGLMSWTASKAVGLWV